MWILASYMASCTTRAVLYSLCLACSCWRRYFGCYNGVNRRSPHRLPTRLPRLFLRFFPGWITVVIAAVTRPPIREVPHHSENVLALKCCTRLDRQLVVRRACFYHKQRAVAQVPH